MLMKTVLTKRLLPVLTVFITSSIFINSWHNRHHLHQRPKSNTCKKDPHFKNPVILLWTPPEAYNEKWNFPQTEICGCGCEVTKNRSRFEESDAVLFYMQTTYNRTDIPDFRKRRENQAYIWWCHESPHTVAMFYEKDLDQFENFFNWTMHYRSDSYVTAAMFPHSARDWYFHQIGRSKTYSGQTADFQHNTRSEKIRSEEFEAMFEKLFQKKTRAATWIVSNCDMTPGAKKRKDFALAMKQKGNYDIDFFGKCFGKEVSYNNEALFDHLQSYKFYLSFENTEHCQEYITEKFWYNSLFCGSVPVVWGPSKESVQKVSPEGSFIHVEDFNFDPVKLVNYLKYLEENTEEYKKYFRWWMDPGFYPIYKLRRTEEFDNDIHGNIYDFETNGFCHLCKLLREGIHKTSSTVIKSLTNDFYGRESEKCFTQ